jgi:hypothetical protein
MKRTYTHDPSLKSGDVIPLLDVPNYTPFIYEKNPYYRIGDGIYDHPKGYSNENWFLWMEQNGWGETKLITII